MRIFVSGCPRSGTTLASLLLAWGCDGLERLPGEQVPRAGTGVIGKRPSVDALAVGDLLREDPLFFVLWMIRDPRDVCVSFHPMVPEAPLVTPEVWLSRARLALKYGVHERLSVLRYEDLVRRPDFWQGRISSWLGIRMDWPWSSWSGEGIHREKIKDKGDLKNWLALCGVRPVETSRIGSHRQSPLGEEIERALKKNSELMSVARRFRYVF